MLRAVLKWPLRQAALLMTPKDERATAFEPPPPLAPGLPQALLAPLTSIDIEAWRRFEGTFIARFDDGRGTTGTLRFEEPEGYEPRSLRYWWRDTSGTIPHFVGRLTLDGPSVAASQLRKTRVSLAINATWRGTTELRLKVAGGAWHSPPDEHRLVIDRGSTPEAEHAIEVEWSGLPREPVRPCPTANLEDLVGLRIGLFGLVDLTQDPAEVLFEASPRGDSNPTHLLRVRADGPITDDAPEHLPNNEWNEANSVDYEYPITALELTATTLEMRGPKWIVNLTGDGLTATVERLD